MATAYSEGVYIYIYPEHRILITINIWDGFFVLILIFVVCVDIINIRHIDIFLCCIENPY